MNETRLLDILPLGLRNTQREKLFELEIRLKTSAVMMYSTAAIKNSYFPVFCYWFPATILGFDMTKKKDF